MQILRRYAVLALWVVLGASLAEAQLTVTLSTSLSSGQPVGTNVVWTASSNGSSSVGYRFNVQPLGGPVRMLRDFSPTSTLQWTSLQEGMYLIIVLAADPSTGATGFQTSQFQFTSRIVNNTPVVSPTSHPLVALYSAPPCLNGMLSIKFRPLSGGEWLTTPMQNCQFGKSLNFYVAGMYPNTTYNLVQQLIVNGNVISGPVLTFQTGAPPFAMPHLTLNHPPDQNTSQIDDVLLTAFFVDAKAYQTPTIATDLSGNLLWYDASLVDPSTAHSYMIRPVPGGNQLNLLSTNLTLGQRLREVDLIGNIVCETSIVALNAQLAELGKPQINWLSHEALRLPNGHTLTFGSVEKILTNVQGPGPVDVVGDMILDLDSNFQVTWTWNSFDWLDNARKATLNDTCTSTSGCGPLHLASTANDWTHSNSIFYTPSDGNIIVSVRHQDWVIKIDYDNGFGAGRILWRLGANGDFAMTSTDPWPWFSHAHDAEFHNGLLSLYDNGNTRITQTGSGDSRGQVLMVDEINKVSSLALNFDMGAYSTALGSARLLSNGNYHFLSGCLGCTTATGPYADQSVEVITGSGTRNYTITWALQAYRSFRLKDLYTYLP
jgi:arylsulfate sulfotransferase